MPDVSFAIVVASLHGRTGKTLLARVIAEYFLLSGEQPFIFDTDAVDHRLLTLFPHDATVIDLAQVPQQMMLFDTMAEASRESRVVDLTHRSFGQFFDLMRQTDFIVEARSRRVEPVIVYIPDRRHDSFEAGVALGRRFPDCAFVVVENAYHGPPRESTRQSEAYRALKAHDLRFVMPRLSPDITEALEEPALSLGDFMRRPLSHADAARLPEELRRARTELRGWLLGLMQEIHRVTRAVASYAAPALAHPSYS